MNSQRNIYGPDRSLQQECPKLRRPLCLLIVLIMGLHSLQRCGLADDKNNNHAPDGSQITNHDFSDDEDNPDHNDPNHLFNEAWNPEGGARKVRYPYRAGFKANLAFSEGSRVSKIWQVINCGGDEDGDCYVMFTYKFQKVNDEVAKVKLGDHCGTLPETKDGNIVRWWVRQVHVGQCGQLRLEFKIKRENGEGAFNSQFWVEHVRAQCGEPFMNTHHQGIPSVQLQPVGKCGMLGVEVFFVLIPYYIIQRRKKRFTRDVPRFLDY